MTSLRDPFAVLGIAPTAEPAVVDAAYRALARLYHPDVAGGDSTQRMQEINWARDELARDPADWRRRVAEPKPPARARPTVGEPAPYASSAPTVPLEWVDVEPQVIFLSGIVGAETRFSARAYGVTPAEIRARVPISAPVLLKRQAHEGSIARFSVAVSEVPQFPGADAYVLPIEIHAPGYSPNRVFVSIQPVTPETVSQTYSPGRIASPRHASADAIVHFGQHKGRTYTQVALENPEYLEWMIANNVQGRIPCECARLALGSGLPQRLAESRSPKRDAQPLRPPATPVRPNSLPKRAPYPASGGASEDPWRHDPLRLMEESRREAAAERQKSAPPEEARRHEGLPAGQAKAKKKPGLLGTIRGLLGGPGP